MRWWLFKQACAKLRLYGRPVPGEQTAMAGYAEQRLLQKRFCWSKNIQKNCVANTLATIKVLIFVAVRQIRAVSAPLRKKTCNYRIMRNGLGGVCVNYIYITTAWACCTIECIITGSTANLYSSQKSHCAIMIQRKRKKKFPNAFFQSVW